MCLTAGGNIFQDGQFGYKKNDILCVCPKGIKRAIMTLLAYHTSQPSLNNSAANTATGICGKPSPPVASFTTVNSITNTRRYLCCTSYITLECVCAHTDSHLYTAPRCNMFLHSTITSTKITMQMRT